MTVCKNMNIRDLQKMNSMEWYHKIRLPDGIVTPGNNWEHLWKPLKQEMQQLDFIGKKVLDIGCWDGMWSFEAEKLGANEVWATDIISQRSFSGQKFETLEFAKKHLNSQIKFKEVSIYEIDEHFSEEFDVVICFGVLYHLRYPQLGIAKIRNVLKPNGVLLLETAVLLDTEDTIIQTDFRKIYPKDVSTWNAFSESALTSLMHESYLNPEEFRVIFREAENMKTGRGFVSRIFGGRQGNKEKEDMKIGRGFVRARAFSGKNYHHYFDDAFLKKYFIPLA